MCGVLAHYNASRCIIQGMKKRYLVLVLLVLFGFMFGFLLQQANAPKPAPSTISLNPEPAPAQKDDLIVLTYPLPQGKVASPLVIKGKARGNWFFEATFPVMLLQPTEKCSSKRTQRHKGTG